MLRHAFTAIAAIIAITVLLGLPGCMDPLQDYRECVNLETARCDLREGCVGNASFDKEFPDFDRDTCVAYAKEHCRTRKIGASDFTQAQVKACIEAIAKTPCDSLAMNVAETRDLEECAFLITQNPDSTDTQSDNPTETASDTETTTSSQTESSDTGQDDTAS
ncbi:MAG: hypothetical protein MUC50_15760 [Myxococcota bacterium]|jgi:hypothetical protein|nr:hypothetical protein [Myxococcota bacterium]